MDVLLHLSMTKSRLIPFWVGLFLLFVPIVSVQGQRLSRFLTSDLRAQAEREVDELLAQMSLEERVGQLIIPIIYPSSSPSAIEQAKRLVAACHAGGILYQKGEAYDQWVMNRALQSSASIPLMITADAEWGLSMRLSNTIRYPRNMALTNVGDETFLYNYGASMAAQCKVMGVHVNFAPVVDINNNPKNPVIGTRSFGATKEEVIRYALAYAKGLEDGGVLSVAKHFPGHGNTSLDSHYALPTVGGGKGDLQETELAPFAAYFAQGLGGVMVAHLNVPSLDNSGTPSSMSPMITTDLLQREMGFDGLIFTDGMQMKGMQQKGKHPISVRALLAGNHLLLGPDDAVAAFKDVCKAVKAQVLSAKTIDENCRKVLCYKWYLFGGSLRSLKIPSQTKEELYAQLNTPEACYLADELWWHSVGIMRSEGTILPLTRVDKQLKYGLLELNTSSHRRSAFTEALTKVGISLTKSRVLTSGSPSSEQRQTLEQLEQCDVVFVNCYTAKSMRALQQTIAQLGARTKVVFTLFASPYALNSWESALRSAKVVACAYEANDEALRAVVARFFNIEPSDLKIVRPPMGKQSPFVTKSAKERLVREEKGTNPSFNRFAAVDEIVRSSLADGVFPGCQVVVLHKGKSVYRKAFGSLDGTTGSPKVTHETIYDVASLTKAFATTPLVMQLVARGAMHLTDRVDKYIPELRFTPVGGLVLQELLLHQSGLTPSINFYLDLIDESSLEGSSFHSYRAKSGWVQLDKNTWANPFFRFSPLLVGEEQKGDFTVPFGSSLFLHKDFPDAMIKRIRETPLKSAKVYRYSDVGFILVGIMIERATGKSLAQLVQEQLFVPMELGTMGYLPLERFAKEKIAPTQKNCLLRGLLRGTVDDESAACRGGVSGNAGLFGTATEVAEVAQMLLDGGKYYDTQIIPAATVRQFLSTRGVGGRRLLGFELGRRGSNVPEAASGRTFGHSGFTGCIVWIDPVHQLVFVFLSNRTYPSRLNTKLITQKTRFRLLEASYKALGIS